MSCVDESFQIFSEGDTYLPLQMCLNCAMCPCACILLRIERRILILNILTEVINTSITSPNVSNVIDDSLWSDPNQQPVIPEMSRTPGIQMTSAKKRKANESDDKCCAETDDNIDSKPLTKKSKPDSKPVTKVTSIVELMMKKMGDSNKSKPVKNKKPCEQEQEVSKPFIPKSKPMTLPSKHDKNESDKTIPPILDKNKPPKGRPGDNKKKEEKPVKPSAKKKQEESKLRESMAVWLISVRKKFFE